MELIAKVQYDCPQFTLYEGHSTADLDVPVSEEKKRQMLSDFPDWFEVSAEGDVVETPEDGLAIDTVESKTSRLRKK